MEVRIEHGYQPLVDNPALLELRYRTSVTRLFFTEVFLFSVFLLILAFQISAHLLGSTWPLAYIGLILFVGVCLLGNGIYGIKYRGLSLTLSIWTRYIHAAILSLAAFFNLCAKFDQWVSDVAKTFDGLNPYLFVCGLMVTALLICAVQLRAAWHTHQHKKFQQAMDSEF